MASLFNSFFRYLHQPAHIAPLVVFRLIFGGVMLASIIRFIAKGWVEELYVEPLYYFNYYGFEWVKPLGLQGMYALFILMGMAAFCIILGLFYRLAALVFFLSFTYVELIDKSNYLNHYYFVSIVALLMVLVPAHRSFSLDVWRRPSLRLEQVPHWCIDIFKLQLGIVYFYAGIAKLNPDWLLEAMPLRIWLPARANLFLIGPLFDKVWVAYLFSWFGAVYDLSIPFLLLMSRTRWLAYFFVVVFHLMTFWLFQIGMFPFIMMGATLIYFSENFHKKVLLFLQGVFYSRRSIPNSGSAFYHSSPLLIGLLLLHFAIQLLLPWRFLLYPGNLFWTEQGYRFSWRVMLMEKAGMVTFFIKDPATGHSWEINNRDYLTLNQEKMMSTQPDMILQFAHFLRQQYQAKGIRDPEVRAESYVSVNGRGSRLFLDSTVNLATKNESFSHKEWILESDE